jgi:hypothetical protein
MVGGEDLPSRKYSVKVLTLPEVNVQYSTGYFPLRGGRVDRQSTSVLKSFTSYDQLLSLNLRST